MFEYIFTIGCFDKMHKGHIKLLESMKTQTEKIIVGLHDNNSIEKLKNISNIDSYDNRKKNLEKYAYDIFAINDVDPTKAIQEYISKHFDNSLTEVYEITKSIIHQDKDQIKKINIEKFHLYGKDGKYLSKKDREKYRDNITILPIGNVARHFYEDNEYRIYNERDKKIDEERNYKYGTLVYSSKNLPYKREEFNGILNNNVHLGGSEDNRYVVFKDDLFVVFNGISKKDNSRQMFLYNIKQTKLCQLYINSYDIRKITQKNWMPYLYEDSLCFIYSICELCVLKLISFDSGECEIVFGHPSKFTNNGLFGGSNLCHWRNNLYIGFIHSRCPYLCIPFLYDAKNYKYISTYSSIDFNLPFNIADYNSFHKIFIFPYYFRKISNKYELSICYQDKYSIKFEISTNAINSLFTNLLKYNQLELIKIGSSTSNSKVIKNDYTGDLFFTHEYKDTFKYHCKNSNITITRTDKNCGWGQDLIGYKKMWCFMRANDNKSFHGIDYVKSIMPVKYLPYSK
jgi:cytidyltransferase-like protein